MELVLVRLISVPSEPKRGVLFFGGSPLCLTLELPYRDNLPNISCIPCGTYSLEERTDVYLHSGTELHRTYEVTPVEGRDGIYFHTGNTINDTKGCILVGCEFDIIHKGIWESKKAFGLFLSLLKPEEKYTLRVKEYFVDA